MPEGSVLPVLAYPSVSHAVQWLSAAFGFSPRWLVQDHRAQLAVGDSAVVVVQGPVVSALDHVMVRTACVDEHRARSQAAGAVVSPITEFPYGEKQYTATDHAGRKWVFSESIRDVAPHEWGATQA